MKCGLLGRKLGHSYSPEIHRYLGTYSYDLFECEPEDLPAFFMRNKCTGLNVTIPYKKDVIPFCDALTAEAEALGAVNTIVLKPDGKRVGHNTDYFGFSSMLARSGLNVNGKKVLVLGSGGASVTVNAVLKAKGAHAVTISRSGQNNYDNLHYHRDASLIVNTTPVGMYPNNGFAPLSLDSFPNLEGVLDLIYNPARTKLLLDAENRGLVANNGLWMLVAQAKESAEWFTGSEIPDSIIEPIYNRLYTNMKNIILIGMPGCGKSTIGKQLADKLGRNFVDSDEIIAEKSMSSIPEIFAKYGESGFRERETQVLRALGKSSGLVIATGGGCVTRAENYIPLHQNGTIYYIERDISLLAREGRPLSQSGDLEEMFRLRAPLYHKFSDACISNFGSVEDSVNEIIRLEEYNENSSNQRTQH